MRETWYVLEDGTVVHPGEVTEENGVLTHKQGRVAMRSPDCPMSRGVDVDESGKLLGSSDSNATKAAAQKVADDKTAAEKAAADKKAADEKAAADAAAAAKQTSDMKPAAPAKAARKPGYKTR